MVQRHVRPYRDPLHAETVDLTAIRDRTTKQNSTERPEQPRTPSPSHAVQHDPVIARYERVVPAGLHVTLDALAVDDPHARHAICIDVVRQSVTDEVICQVSEGHVVDAQTQHDGAGLVHPVEG